MQHTIGDGKMGGDFSLINPILDDKNLKIKLNTTVSKVIIEKKKAVGVETILMAELKIFLEKKLFLLLVL